MDKIKFANGSTYDCISCTATPAGTAFITLGGVTWSQAAQIFSNESNTRTIEYANRVLNGFTELVDLGKQPNGIQAILKGGTIIERS